MHNSNSGTFDEKFIFKGGFINKELVQHDNNVNKIKI